MVSFFGFGKSKCDQCGMELKAETDVFEWGDKKFCSKGCKLNYRHGKENHSCCH